jgi:hypothetical protein
MEERGNADIEYIIVDFGGLPRGSWCLGYMDEEQNWKVIYACM